MDNVEEQIRALQTSVRRQRFAIVALAILLAFVAEELRPAGDATFHTITCKAWRVVDKDGKERIRAGTVDGDAGVTWFDTDGKMRIAAFAAADGLARVAWFDKEGKERIGASTFADGLAGIGWLDRDGKERIAAGTQADGTVIYPTADGK